MLLYMFDILVNYKIYMAFHIICLTLVDKYIMFQL